MATSKGTGTCMLCGRMLTKGAMTRHLTSCIAKEEETGWARLESGDRAPDGYHLVVAGSYLPQYWLHVAISSNAKLADLDAFLRGIWLECCGHLSAFALSGKTYASYPMRELGQRSMNPQVGKLLSPGLRFSHIYDFGTSTELALRVVGLFAAVDAQQRGNAGSSRRRIAKRIELLASNDPPDIACAECGRPANAICAECRWEGEGWLCDACARNHACGEEMLLPMVNSPRVGECGYTGE